MNILHSLVLGIVQGLTEFWPVSSSGHLVIIPEILGWKYQGLSFDVALHAGTALALLIFFWREWLVIIGSAFGRSKSQDLTTRGYPRNLLWQILVASIPAGIIGLVIDKYVESNFHSLIFIAFNFAFFGWLLWFVDKKVKTSVKPGELTYKKSFLIGLSQSIALIPGVSRSGITITASRWIGLSREEAAKFSFLIATPTIIGAFLIKLPSILQGGIDLHFWIGIIAATLSGLFAIKFLLNFLKKGNFLIFTIYRFVVALIIICFLILK